MCIFFLSSSRCFRLPCTIHNIFLLMMRESSIDVRLCRVECADCARSAARIFNLLCSLTNTHPSLVYRKRKKKWREKKVGTIACDLVCPRKRWKWLKIMCSAKRYLNWLQSNGERSNCGYAISDWRHKLYTLQFYCPKYCFFFRWLSFFVEPHSKTWNPIESDKQ